MSSYHINCLRSLALLGLDVGLNIELSEEEEETQDVNEVDEDNAEAGLLALGGEEVGGLAHHGDELDHLHEGEVGLPPDGEGLAGLVVLGVHADEVVGVHDGVDEAVEEDGEVDVSVVVDVGVEPVEEEDGGVVVNMEEGELAPLLADDDEDGVPEVPDLCVAENSGVFKAAEISRGWEKMMIFREREINQQEQGTGHLCFLHVTASWRPFCRRPRTCYID